MNGPLMGVFLNHKHACSRSFSSNLGTANSLLPIRFSTLFFPLLPSPTVSISVHPVSSDRIQHVQNGKQFIVIQSCFILLNTLNLPRSYCPPYCRSSMVHSKKKVLQGKKKPSECILSIPLPIIKTVVPHHPRLMPKASFNHLTNHLNSSILQQSNQYPNTLFQPKHHMPFSAQTGSLWTWFWVISIMT